jgi:hypothetical protein
MGAASHLNSITFEKKEEDDIDYITGVTARGNVPRSHPTPPLGGVMPPIHRTRLRINFFFFF